MCGKIWSVARAWVFCGLAFVVVFALTESVVAVEDRFELEVQTQKGDVELVVRADRKEIGVADQLTLSFTVFTPPNRVVAFPRIGEQLGPFRVVSHSSVRPQKDSGLDREEWRQEYILEPNAVGEEKIPPMAITVGAWERSMSVACRYLDIQDRDVEGKCDRTTEAPPPQTLMIKTPPLTLLVTTVLADDADLAAPLDIAPPVSVTKPPVRLAFWAMCIAVAAATGVVFYWLVRRKRRESVGVAASGRPAHIVILEMLRKMQEEALPGCESVDAFYVRLSDILRRYAFWRFGISAKYKTTEELIANAELSDGVLIEHLTFVREFFGHCDVVKFARHRPEESTQNECLEDAIRFVATTGDNNVLVLSEDGGK